jgi:hypothetical protein
VHKTIIALYGTDADSNARGFIPTQTRHLQMRYTHPLPNSGSAPELKNHNRELFFRTNSQCGTSDFISTAGKFFSCIEIDTAVSIVLPVDPGDASAPSDMHGSAIFSVS